MIGVLDYEPTEIRMLAESQAEVQKRIMSCSKEPESVIFLESMEEGSTFYDLGANTGAYTLIAASRGVNVVAFECSVPNAEHLRRNVELNELRGKVVIVIDPLWSHEEVVSFCYSSREPGAALHTINGQSADREVLTAFPLDYWTHPPEGRGALALPPPDYIKLDVDGCELQVLQGATKTLKKVHALQVEVDDSLPSRQVLTQLLYKAGFRVQAEHRHGQTSISNVWWSR